MEINKNNKFLIKSKKQMFAVIAVFTLMLFIGGTTYAFFNYTRTGERNLLQTGSINFSAEQDTISLSNAFPIERSSASTDQTNTDDLVITVTGDTTYSGGVEYLLTATAVENTKNNKTVPISIMVTGSNGIGTADEEYFDNRGGNSPIYKVLADDTVENNEQLLVGYIPTGPTGVNGTVTIRAFFDKTNVGISDTYNDGETPTNDKGTPVDFGSNRTVLTTSEWNTLNVSFKVKVEAQEGTWVDEVRTVNAMSTFPTVITDQKANIKEVYFNKMGATRMQNAYDAATIKADLTYNNEGKVLAWLVPDTVDNTKYIMYVASDGETYLPSVSAGLFENWLNMEKIEFNNANTSRITIMPGMFQNCSSLRQLDLSSWDTRNVTNMSSMFYGCNNLTSINLTNLGSNSLSAIVSMFHGCTSLKTLNMSGFNFGTISNLSGANSPFYNVSSLENINLSNANMSNVTELYNVFSNMSNLQVLDLSNVSTGVITGIADAFSGCKKVIEINLSSFTISNTAIIQNMFKNCSELEKIYVSNSWDVSSSNYSKDMFAGCTALVGKSPNGTTYTFDSSKIDKTMAVIATDTTPGYLTDISLKPTN